MANLAVIFVVTLLTLQGSVAKAELQAEHRQGFILPRGILDFFRELRENSEYIIQVASQLPARIAEIRDQLNEIIANINISTVISQLRSEVEDIIDQGGQVAEQCRKPAETKLDDLASKAEAESRACMDEAEAKVDKIQEAVEARIAEAQQFLKDVNSQIFNCLLNNPLAFTRCLECKYPTYKQKLQNLQQSVIKTLNEAEAQAGTLIQDFTKCMNTVQMNLIKQGQVIIAETEECVSNAQ